ncbi:MAG: RNA polymerase sigma factor [Acidimicrobiales bacterium]
MTAPDSGQIFTALWAAHHDAVLAYCRRRAPADVAGDAATATFEVLWRRVDDLPADPLPWLYAVARRELANRRRAESRLRAFAARLTRERRMTGADVAPDASSEAMDRSRARGALRRLRPDDRELLMLVAWDGLSPTAAAASLGISVPTLTVRLHRARQRLESELAALNQEEPL